MRDLERSSSAAFGVVRGEEETKFMTVTGRAGLPRAPRVIPPSLPSRPAMAGGAYAGSGRRPMAGGALLRVCKLAAARQECSK